MKKQTDIAILGGGNIGMSLANGLVKSGNCKAKNIIITRRSKEHLRTISEKGFTATTNNSEAVLKSEIIILSVLPGQVDALLKSIAAKINPEKHMLISVVTGVSSADIFRYVSKKVQVVLAMPNTAIAIGESMTCIASPNATGETMNRVKELFDSVGLVAEIREDQMTSATALNACGIAFFLRAIRAASQGGVQIGFHAEDALKMASQTAKGASALLLHSGKHPESEIDKVTSPEGCTIAGLNEMEHQGFSSSLIKGITTSAAKAAGLYKKVS